VKSPVLLRNHLQYKKAMIQPQDPKSSRGTEIGRTAGKRPENARAI
jgi:hypothetical protein